MWYYPLLVLNLEIRVITAVYPLCIEQFAYYFHVWLIMGRPSLLYHEMHQ